MPPSADDIRKALKASAPTLQRALVGSVVGSATGAGAGAALGAATAKPGERAQGAKTWARRGAITGAVSGALPSLFRGGQAATKSRYISEQQRHLDSLYESFSKLDAAGKANLFHDRIYPAEENLAQHMKQYESLLAPVPHLEVVRQATIGGGIGSSTQVAAAKIRDFVMSRLQSRSAAPPTTSATTAIADAKTASQMSLLGVSTVARVTLTKSANDPLAPDKGEPLPSETSPDRKARRIAELLKRSMPTGTAEGSASPTPKRGTP